MNRVNRPQLEASLYNLAGASPSTAVRSHSISASDQYVGFSPHGGSLLIEALTGTGQSQIDVYRATDGVQQISDSVSFQSVPGSGDDSYGAVGLGFSPDAGDRSFLYGYVAANLTSTTRLVRGDVLPEADETLTLTASTVSGAGVATVDGSGIGIGTVVDDDRPPQLAIGDAQTIEGSTGHVVSLTITLSRPATATTTVAWATSNGSASAGSDYTAASGTATFAAGSTSTTVAVTVLADGVTESSESFTVRLSAPTGGAGSQNAGGSCVIVDDDGQT